MTSARNASDNGHSDDIAHAPCAWMLPDQPRIAGIVAWEWNVQAGTIRLSPEWENILQSKDYNSCKPHDKEWWTRRVHKDDAQAFMRAYEDIVRGKSDKYEVLFRIQRADGCWAWLLSRGSVTEKKSGKAALISGMMIDISQLRTDPKFQMSSVIGNASYHAMLENSPDLYVRMDRELFPLYINPVVAQYMNRERDQYSFTEPLEDLKIQPEQLAFLQKNVNRVFEEKTAIREMVTFTSAFGEQVTGEYSFWPEFDPDGNVICAMTQFRDLTEQVRTANRARLNEQRLDALYKLTQMDNASEAEVLNFLMDCILKLTASSSAFIFIPTDGPDGTGDMLWSEDHYRQLDRCHLPQDSFPADLVSLTTEPDGSVNYRSLRNGDGKNPVHVSFDGCMPVMRSMIAPAKEGERIVCIAGVCNKPTDYTEADLQQLETFINNAWLVIRRQRFMRELRRAKEAAEHANRVKDRFMANVSHELRTPLNGMLSMLQLMELLPLSDVQRDYLKAANTSGKSLLRIISDILDFSRMESGRMQLSPEAVNLKESLHSTMGLFQSQAEEKGLAFSFAIDEALPDTLLADEARVRQILFNVVGNALKFTEKGGIRLDCALLPQADDDKVRLGITVADTGIGIPKEQQTAVFEAFTQVDSSSTRKYSGTGLGLSIVKQLVSLMDGSVWMESEVGRGTTVRCILAFSRPDAVADLKTGAPAPGRQTGPVLDILVAEDDDVSRFAIRAFLERAGHRPLCLADGRQALEALMLHDFDCLFTDIQMPDMDGLEVAERIRNGRLGDISPSGTVRALVAEYKAKAASKAADGQSEAKSDNAAGARSHGAAQKGKSGKAPATNVQNTDGQEDSRPIDPRLPVVAVSAHAMSGDRERFLLRGVDYYISKPIRMEQLNEVLAGVQTARAGRRANK